ncbi:septal ring lytic transglycosylase RlpA family protein [Alteromonadaceae bacterium M269]|nr:septal ring lytic transglycosylase RlpA family protein [Alteromonadaceae bacterium M269]
MNGRTKVLLALVTFVLTACTTPGRYSQRIDSAPAQTPRNVATEDAVPRYEPETMRANKPYSVFGTSYTPMSHKAAKSYSAKGVSSWYGQKFHGHLTSNGETYNMFEMSAAHKTLPLPSYVKVTNLDNKKTVIVRVNDRGPFHGNRLIDLSFAAATKIDMLKTGVANVQIDVIHVDKQGNKTIAGNPVNKKPASKKSENWYVQVAALQDKKRADEIAQGLALLYQVKTHTPFETGVFKLRLGPLDNEDHAIKLLQEVKQNGYENAYKLKGALGGYSDN